MQTMEKSRRCLWQIEYLVVWQGGAMNSETASGESTSEHDFWKIALWVFAFGGSIAMLHYEYLWSRFALRNPETNSFGEWFWGSLEIAIPWNLCFMCLTELRKGVRNGNVGRDAGLKIAVWAEMLMLSTYWWLSPEIQRLTSLGALK